MHFSLHRRQRSAGIRWEHCKGHYFNLTVGSPTHHAWWAFDLYLYYGGRHGAQSNQ
jgi:hypothetical protein